MVIAGLEGRFRLHLKAFAFGEPNSGHSSCKEKRLLPLGLQSCYLLGFFPLIILTPSCSFLLTLYIMVAAFPEPGQIALLAGMLQWQGGCFAKHQVSAEMQFLCFLCLAVGVTYLRSLES